MKFLTLPLLFSSVHAKQGSVLSLIMTGDELLGCAEKQEQVFLLLLLHAWAFQGLACFQLPYDELTWQRR